MEINLLEVATSTSSTKKITIEGQTKDFTVYRIPLRNLYYNDQNDRVSIEYSKYIKAHLNDDKILNFDEKNELFENLITESDEKSLRKTKESIRNMSQREPGVVFSDGRILDGNRRFTCLRKLLKETNENRFAYFEAVIIENTDYSHKAIKIMELELQHGVDEKVDYSPISKLFGVYRDVVRDKIISKEEYAAAISTTVKEVESMIKHAEIVSEFLNHINYNEDGFDIANDLDIDGPIREVALIEKNMEKNDYSNDKVQGIKNILFDNIVVKSHGDITRRIREIGKKIVGSENEEKFILESEPLSEILYNKIINVDNISANFIKHDIRNDKELNANINTVCMNYFDKSNHKKVIEKPHEIISECKDKIRKIDMELILRFHEPEKQNFLIELRNLEKSIYEIKSKLEVDHE